MRFSKEFKESLSDLPSKEKDRLLFRLLKKDPILAERLHFELVSGRSVDEQREIVKAKLAEMIDNATEGYYSPGYLNMDIRYMGGEITLHLKTTQDKFGEVQLNLYMLNEILERNRDRMLEAPPGRVHKLCVAIIARAYKIMGLTVKLHEDYWADLQDDLKRLGQLIGGNPYLMEHAMDNGLNVNWLISGEIPGDINEIQKQLRRDGYLK